MSILRRPKYIRIAAVLAVPLIAALGLLWWGPIAQPAWYHRFADSRTLLGIPNFWNVVTNAGYLLAACYGLVVLKSGRFLERWERTAYVVLASGVTLLAFGSGYYHLWPDDATLVWDRLPMTVGFTSLIAIFVGERIGSRAGRLLLTPLVAAGALSVLHWKWSGDLRAYLLVQIAAVALLPVLMLLFPPRYTGSAGLAAMVALYCAALLLDLFDREVSAWIVTGGHPWKHVSSSAAVFFYFRTVRSRRPVPELTQVRAG